MSDLSLPGVAKAADPTVRRKRCCPMQRAARVRSCGCPSTSHMQRTVARVSSPAWLSLKAGASLTKPPAHLPLARQIIVPWLSKLVVESSCFRPAEGQRIHGDEPIKSALKGDATLHGLIQTFGSTDSIYHGHTIMAYLFVAAANALAGASPPVVARGSKLKGLVDTPGGGLGEFWESYIKDVDGSMKRKSFMASTAAILLHAEVLWTHTSHIPLCLLLRTREARKQTPSLSLRYRSDLSLPHSRLARPRRQPRPTWPRRSSRPS